LLIADKLSSTNREVKNRNSKNRDIEVTFSEALRGAIGVAAKNISEVRAKLPNLQEAIAILKPEGVQKLGKVKKENEIIIVDQEGKPSKYKDIVKHVDSAFTCIIDLAAENPHSYFWLGYCHSRGISAIPIYRDFSVSDSQQKKIRGKAEENETEMAGDGNDTEDKYKEKNKAEHVIAFDIRALWYIRYRPERTKELAAAIRSALEELVSKDIPRLQRNIFWERLTREPKIYIYTGAVHHKELKREVVGDWDQRTVSELVRYISSAEVSVIPELERPIYSPGSIKYKLGICWNQE
jgi:hypothetical protein